MQALLDDVDGIKTATLKKLDQVYQAVVIARRRRLIKLKKKQAEADREAKALNAGNGQRQEPDSQTGSANKNTQGGQGGGRRRLHQNGDMSFRALMDTAGLRQDQPGLYDFGHISESEQNFRGLAPPSRTQNPA